MAKVAVSNATKTFQSFPEKGDIDQGKSDCYDPVFSEEHLTIELVFEPT
jgi:hypothetical protein